MFEWQAKLISDFKKELCAKLSQREFSNSRYPFEKTLEKVRKKEEIKIIFYVTDCAKWSSDSLFKELKKKTCVKVNIALLKVSPIEAHEKNLNFFKEIDESLIELYDSEGNVLELLSFEPDLIFYEQPWCLDEINKIESVSKSCLTANIPYGFMLIDSDIAHYYQPFHFCLWRYFAENEAQKKLFKEKNKFLANRIVNLGYPKLDAYFEKTQRKSKKKTVIYAPHCSVSGCNINYSTFDKNCDYFLEKARKTPEINWIYKPHPMLRKCLNQTGFMKNEEYDSYVKEWAKLDNVKINSEGNYFEAFKSSDLLITDSVSFLAEYLPTGNPIIHLKNDSDCGFNKIAKNIIKNYYKAYNIEEIENFFTELVFKDNDFYREKRMQALSLVMDNKVPAGENIANYLVKTFELE